MSIGIRVALNNLFGGESTMRAIEAAKGKEIKRALMPQDEEDLRILFTDGTGIKIWDDGQSCCESRYMRTDDDLSYFNGATFQNAQIQNGPDEEGEYGTHETQFLIITTSKGSFTVVNHNEHNGYYGGFSMACQEI